VLSPLHGVKVGLVPACNEGYISEFVAAFDGEVDEVDEDIDG
jgi:hypothetical protein